MIIVRAGVNNLANRVSNDAANKDYADAQIAVPRAGLVA